MDLNTDAKATIIRELTMVLLEVLNIILKDSHSLTSLSTITVLQPSIHILNPMDQDLNSTRHLIRPKSHISILT